MLIPEKYHLPIALAGFSFWLIGALIKITHAQVLGVSGNMILVVGGAISLIVWVEVLAELLKTYQKNRLIWIIALFIFGIIGPILYLLTKRKAI